MQTNPSDPLNAFRKLCAAVQEDPSAPYSFEVKVMRRVAAVAAGRPNPFTKFLWQGAITSIVCAVLSGSILYFNDGDFDEDAFGELEEAQSVQLEME